MPNSENRSEHRAMGWAAIGGALVTIGGTVGAGLAFWGATSHLWGDDYFLAGFVVACLLTALGVYVLVAEFIGGLPLPPTRYERAQAKEASDPKELTLDVNSLVLSGLGAANLPRLQLWVKAVNLGAPTILHDWQLRVSTGERTEAAEHLAGAGQQPNRTQMRALDEMTGTTPFQGEATGLVYFVLPKTSRSSFEADLAQAVLSLSVKDQDGVEWATERHVNSLGPAEKYDPNA